MLPGQLTIGHVKAADARGQKVLTYKRITYTLGELYELAGIRRITSEPAKGRRLDKSGDQNRIRKSSRKYNQQDQVEKSPVGEKSGSSDSEGAPA